MLHLIKMAENITTTNTTKVTKSVEIKMNEIKVNKLVMLYNTLHLIIMMIIIQRNITEKARRDPMMISNNKH